MTDIDNRPPPVLPADPVIYKICPAESWAEAVASGVYAGSPADRADGFIHLSAADQVAGTLHRHFAGQAGLVLVAVEARRLGSALRWEASRGGALFPHLYGPLPADAAVATAAVPLGPDGRHAVPALPMREGEG